VNSQNLGSSFEAGIVIYTVKYVRRSDTPGELHEGQRHRHNMSERSRYAATAAITGEAQEERGCSSTLAVHRRRCRPSTGWQQKLHLLSREFASVHMAARYGAEVSLQPAVISDGITLKARIERRSMPPTIQARCVSKADRLLATY